jgi:Pyruvate/2-oxoacid:ferredoxin oxidoreductase delta subunit
MKIVEYRVLINQTSGEEFLGQVDSHTHFVCTPDEALEILKSRDEFWISDCICRRSSTGCSHPRIDVCLEFHPHHEGDKFHTREVSLTQAEELIEEARRTGLVARPWRSNENPERIFGICFCCTCCCTVFHADNEGCEKGRLIERTRAEYCAGCAHCADSCHFNARRISYENLEIDRSNCYGCGLCAEACPVEGIDMVKRTGHPDETSVMYKTPAWSRGEPRRFAKPAPPPL